MSTNEKKGPQTAKSGAREENIGGRHYNMAGQPSPVVQAKARITHRVRDLTERTEA